MSKIMQLLPKMGIFGRKLVEADTAEEVQSLIGGSSGAAAPTITGIDVDAAAGTVTTTLSDGKTVAGTYKTA